MRTAQEWFDMHRAKHPNLPDELRWRIAVGRGLEVDPAEADQFPDALVPDGTARRSNRKDDRSEMAGFFRLDAADPITALMLDALELAWEYPERPWFQAVRRFVYRESFAMPSREGYTRPEEDFGVALITRTWAGRDLIGIWEGEPSALPGRAAILAVAALVLQLPKLSEEFRDDLHEAAKSWPEAREFLYDAADRHDARDPVGMMRQLLRGVPTEGVYGSMLAVDDDSGEINEWARIDSGWRVQFDGRTVFFPPLKGMADLAELVAKPNTPIWSYVLAGGTSSKKHPRPTKQEQRRTMKAVGERVSRAMERIREKYPALWQHLQAVSTGNECVYAPPDGTPLWVVTS